MPTSYLLSLSPSRCLSHDIPPFQLLYTFFYSILFEYTHNGGAVVACGSNIVTNRQILIGNKVFKTKTFNSVLTFWKINWIIDAIFQIIRIEIGCIGFNI